MKDTNYNFNTFDLSAMPIMTTNRGRTESLDRRLFNIGSDGKGRDPSPIIVCRRRTSPRVSPSPLRKRSPSPAANKINSTITDFFNSTSASATKPVSVARAGKHQHRRVLSLPVVHSKYAETISLRPVRIAVNTSPNMAIPPSRSLQELIVEEKWHAVARRVKIYPKEAETKMFMSIRGETSECLPLHWAAMSKATPQAIQALIDAFPGSVTKKETLHGAAPVHLACMVNADYEVMKVLIQARPESLRIANNNGDLPLHLACSRGTTDVVHMLLKVNPDSAKVPNKKGLLPLIFAVARFGACEDMVQELLRIHPDAIEAKDDAKCHPIHLATMWRAPIEIVKILIQARPHLVRVKDKFRRTPYTIARRVCRFSTDHPTVVALSEAMLDTSNFILKVGALLEINSSAFYDRAAGGPKPVGSRRLRNMTYG
mmetsp:Transcript_8868/g.13132  ORF Transcript_8868/g.13132 Transcript_8868/m.13132 type:complete len:429 (-) Transcript_8868:357-1643(-)|eukprot:CAMPEP_0116014704 /NCGR_PEP_ID=MMETSP0321-20121206/6414_1 /TAXON_ID=163516 /ORGANISM="Leptocylindrus danicus var. danicus, Strain B650" /LENGTH=428 /DNA_ID=CAMNT_0003484363 /DNA_START=98 /DNA_END=1384 /DNA_ORIENTATION=+